MPYNSTDDLPESVKNNLPSHAQRIYMKAFNSAWDGTCKDSDDKEACSAKVAWSAVKNSYEKDEEGSWHKKSELQEFSMFITKASLDEKTGLMTWSAVASDTDKDFYNQAMSKELFQDFISRAESKELVPEAFRSKYWKGGMPYVSVSHYPDFDGDAAAGETSCLYIDGDKLKAKGIFYDTDLGKACFNAVRKSVKESTDNKVRISIAFLDWKHRHEDKVFVRESLTSHCPMCEQSEENVVFLRGQLIHLALTRVPANSRTTIDAEVTKSMATQFEDAESIVGTEQAKKLEEKSTLIQKSEAVVIKSEEGTEEVSTNVETPESIETPTEAIVEEAKKPEKEEEPEDMEEDEEEEKDKKKEPEAKSAFEDEVREFMAITKDALTKLAVPLSVEDETHPLDDALSNFKTAYDIITKSTVSPDEKLMGLQEPMNQLAEVVKSSVKVSESGSTATNETSTDDIQEMISKSIQEALQPIAESISLLTAQKSMGQDTYRQGVPAPRSISPSLVAKAATKKASSETPKLRKLIEASTKSTSARL